MAEKKENLLKAPPQSLDAERAVLGSILIRPDTMNDVVEVITADSFYSHKHKIVWRVLSELIAKNNPIDILSVSNLLSERNELESAGGRVYIGELMSSVPSASNARHYADIVHKKNIMRRLIETGERIKDAGYDEEAPVDELLDQANKLVNEVTNMTPHSGLVVLKDLHDTTWDRFEKIHENKGATLRGIPTGFKDLDNLLSGFQKSDLIILAARPSMGKTSLALDIARHVAIRSQTPVCLFSLEMSNEQLIDRMLAAEANVNSFHLRTGKIPDQYFNHVRDALGALSGAPIYVDDQGSNNIIKMRAVARKLQREGKLGLIIVDYLQLMTPGNVKNDNLVQQITEISHSLKQLAKEFNIPVLALSQLSRAVEQRGGKPRLSDLRDSGSIEQDADIVMFIHSEDKYADQADKTNITEILIEKHRNGPTGSVKFYFDKDKSTFMSLEKNDFGDFGKGA